MKIKSAIFTLLMLAANASFGQGWVPRYFLDVEQMPDATLFLPDYPRPGSPLFSNDSIVYEQSKLIRILPPAGSRISRGEQAIADTSLFVSYFMQRFGDEAGISLTPEEYPLLADFLDMTYTTIRLSIKKAKKVYARPRPYQYFHESTPVPSQEEPDDFTSYPSGHAIRAWGAALTMVAVDPEHQNEYLNVGWELGQSRVIVGFHYQSDVDAARIAASAGFARLVADEHWQNELKKVQQEFRSKSKK